MTEPTLLIVDDCESDIFLVRRALKKAQVTCPVQEARNGEIAIDYLSGTGVFGNRHEYPMPGLMLLDLNMPMKNGFDVLEWVRSYPALNALVVIVTTASLRSEDVERAFTLKANSYLVKPSNMDALVNMVRSICDWTRINHFPPGNAMVVR